MLLSQVGRAERLYAAQQRARRTTDAILSAVPNPGTELTAEIERVSRATAGLDPLGAVWGGAAGADSIPDLVNKFASRVADELRLSSEDASRMRKRIADALADYANVERTGAMHVDPVGTAVTDAGTAHLDLDMRRGMSTLQRMNRANADSHEREKQRLWR